MSLHLTLKMHRKSKFLFQRNPEPLLKTFSDSGELFHVLSPGIISDELLNRANEIITKTLLEAGGPPNSRETSSVWIKAKRSIRSHPDILNLIKPVIGELNSFEKGIFNSARLGLRTYDHFKVPRHCQIALRFPGERVGEPFEWHVDKGYFDILVGIYLNDNMEENHGNFTVWPTLVSSNADVRKGIYQSDSKVNAGSPEQICLLKGSVIIANRRLCHGTAPNNSTSYTRRVIWFRLHKKRE